MAQPANMPNLKHGCIIMASGMGTRFGGNKLIAKLDGIPLVEYVLRATEGQFASRVVVTRHADVAQLAQNAGVKAVLHDKPRRNDTVALGMAALPNCDDVTFFQADQPLVAAQSVAALVRAAEGDPDSIWRIAFKGASGAPVLFPTWAFDELRRLPAGKGGGYVAKMHPSRVKTVEAASAWELFDVDTIEDLQALRRHMMEMRER